MLYFSKTTLGFYDSEITIDIPSDAIVITQDVYTSVYDAHTKGKIISSDEFGNPIAIDPPNPTDEELANIKAAQLQAELNSINHLFYDEQAGDIPVGTWKAKRDEIKLKYQ